MQYPMLDDKQRFGYLTGGTFMIYNKQYPNGKRVKIGDGTINRYSKNMKISVASYNNIQIPIFENFIDIAEASKLVIPVTSNPIGILISLIYDSDSGWLFGKIEPMSTASTADPTIINPAGIFNVVYFNIDNNGRPIQSNEITWETVKSGENLYEICYDLSAGSININGTSEQFEGAVLAFQISQINDGEQAANVYIGYQETSESLDNLVILSIPTSIDTTDNQNMVDNPVFINFSSSYHSIKAIQELQNKMIETEDKANDALSKANQAESAIDDLGSSLEGSYLAG